MASQREQYIRARSDVESSLANVRSICDKWQSAQGDNPDNLSRKEIEQLGKAFKNKLLTLKWDCEDLEEIVNLGDYDPDKDANTEAEDSRRFITETRLEIQLLMDKLSEGDAKGRIFSKHGIAFPNPANTATAILTNNGSAKYERLTANEGDVVEFDIATAGDRRQSYASSRRDSKDGKSQMNASTSSLGRSGHSTVNIHVNPNENEMMLDMLEAEYYNPQPSVRYSRLNIAYRKFVESEDHGKIVGYIVAILSLPIVIVIWLLAR